MHSASREACVRILTTCDSNRPCDAEAHQATTKLSHVMPVVYKMKGLSQCLGITWRIQNTATRSPPNPIDHPSHVRQSTRSDEADSWHEIMVISVRHMPDQILHCAAFIQRLQGRMRVLILRVVGRHELQTLAFGLFQRMLREHIQGVSSLLASLPACHKQRVHLAGVIQRDLL